MNPPIGCVGAGPAVRRLCGAPRRPTAGGHRRGGSAPACAEPPAGLTHPTGTIGPPARRQSFFWANSHLNSSGSLYAGSQELWPTSGYSVNFGLPPAFSRAAIMFRDRAGLTAVSLAPWNAQMGTLLIRAAVASSAPPHTGAAAANKSGRRATRSHVPYPPMDRPVM